MFKFDQLVSKLWFNENEMTDTKEYMLKEFKEFTGNPEVLNV